MKRVILILSLAMFGCQKENVEPIKCDSSKVESILSGSVECDYKPIDLGGLNYKVYDCGKTIKILQGDASNFTLLVDSVKNDTISGRLYYQDEYKGFAKLY